MCVYPAPTSLSHHLICLNLFSYLQKFHMRDSVKPFQCFYSAQEQIKYLCSFSNVLVLLHAFDLLKKYWFYIWVKYSKFGARFLYFDFHKFYSDHSQVHKSIMHSNFLCSLSQRNGRFSTIHTMSSNPVLSLAILFIASHFTQLWFSVTYIFVPPHISFVLWIPKEGPSSYISDWFLQLAYYSCLWLFSTLNLLYIF